MDVCGNIACVAYDYEEDNNCLECVDVGGCVAYRNHLKQTTKTENMTATEVLSRNAQFKKEYMCDWGSTHSADAFAYATEQMSRIINPPIIIKENKNMNEFDNALTNAKNGTLTNLTEKAENLKEVAKATATRTKNTVVRVKVGRLAIAAIKSAIKKTPGIPAPVKIMLDSEYADIVIGAVVPVILPMITTNERVLRVGEDITIAGGVAIADKLGFIDKMVSDVMDQISDTISDAVPQKKEL